MHECLDIFGERMTTTINGDAWGGTTFEITDANGAMSGSVDGAGCWGRRVARECGLRADAARSQGCGSGWASCAARCTPAARLARARCAWRARCVRAALRRLLR
jgi:hypothetical protein